MIALIRKLWRRRALYGFVVGFALLLLGFFIDRELTRQAGEKRHAAIVAQLDSTDPRWRYEEVEADRGVLADEQNSALLVPKFKQSLASPQFDSNPLLGSDYRISDHVNHVLSDEFYDALEMALSANKSALQIAVSFERFQTGMWRTPISADYISTDFTKLQDLRPVFRLLDLAAEGEGRNGRSARAFAYVLPMFNVGRSLEREPNLIACLIRLAGDRIAVIRVERTLALCNPTCELATVQAALLQEANADLFWYAMRGERAGLDHLWTNLRSGRVKLNDLAKSGGKRDWFMSSIGNWYVDPYLANDHALMLEVCTKAYEARLLPEELQRAELEAFKQSIRALPELDTGSLLTRLLIPAFNKIHDASLAAKANLRCAATGIAVERFRLKHGRWPNSLEEIPRNLLASVPLDPFDGQPLKYARRDDGVTVYSIGIDETDNDATIGVGRNANGIGKDLGFRLFNPDRRGLPALAITQKTDRFTQPPGQITDTDIMAELGPPPRERD